MAILVLVTAIILFACFKDAKAIDLVAHQDIPEFLGLINRGIETIPSPLSLGHKYMTENY
uniref:Uncharacterized protein n=1 Tax=Onchocerca volvulus TaxID=6282 RepID=A0A8R1XRQ7_ONCVO